MLTFETNAILELRSISGILPLHMRGLMSALIFQDFRYDFAPGCEMWFNKPRDTSRMPREVFDSDSQNDEQDENEFVVEHSPVMEDWQVTDVLPPASESSDNSSATNLDDTVSEPGVTETHQASSETLASDIDVETDDLTDEDSDSDSASESKNSDISDDDLSGGATLSLDLDARSVHNVFGMMCIALMFSFAGGVSASF